VLVLPDEVIVDETLAAKLSAYVAAGGSLIASHRSGLARTARTPSRRASRELFGVRYAG
jgi:hypothetical protein